MKLQKMIGVGAVVCFISFCVVVEAVPIVLNYQGKVTVGSTVFSGTGHFRFALVDADGSTVYWTSDGNPIPLTDIDLTVTDGLFEVSLGDPDVMNPINPGVFNNDDLYLRVWFNDGSTGMERLDPDRRIESSGFAIKARSCVLDDDNPDDDSEVPDDISINNGSLFALSGANNIGIGTTNPRSKLSLGEDLLSKKLALYDGENDFYGFGLEVGRLNILAGNTVKMSILQTNRVGIGTTDPGSNLDVYSNSGTAVQITSGNETSPELFFKRTGDGYTDWKISAGDQLIFSASENDGHSWTEKMRLDESGNLGIGTTVSDARLNVAGIIYSNAGFKFPDLTIQRSAFDGHSLDAADGSPMNALYVNDAGNVGIGTTTPEEKLQVFGTIYSSNGGFVFPDQTVQTSAFDGNSLDALGGDPEDALYVDENGNVGIGTIGPYVTLHVNTGTDASVGIGGYLMLGHTAADNLVMDTNEIIARNNHGAANLHIQKDSGDTIINENSGSVGLGTASPGNHKLKVVSNTSDLNRSTCHIENLNGSGTALTVSGYSTNAPALITQNGSGDLFQCWTNSGDSHAVFTVRQDGITSRGNLIIEDESTGDTVVEIGSGLDYAEGFDLTDRVIPEPGVVLVIDSEHPGMLTVSSCAYDRRVAGIVAGAGGIKSGVRLGNTDFDCDVALAGRVYCYVEAHDSEINPGDLLTTSSVPGYAMKVLDFTVAQGAVLGKAMEHLDKGDARQILVLVTLQ